MEAAGIEPESSTTHQGNLKQLKSALEALGGNWEDGQFSDCHCLAGIDAGLGQIIKVWHALPEALRKEVEAMCLEPASREMSE